MLVFIKRCIFCDNILQNIHENIMKCYRLNLYKEIAIGFNHDLQMISEFPASLSEGLLV